MSNPFIQPITILGETRGRGPAKRFGIHQADRLFHTYIIGQTGTGKSTLLLNMLKQDADYNRGFCLIDPHGDLAHAAKSYLSQDGIYWDVADPECQYGYNPLTYVAEKHRPLVTSGIIETLKQQWSDAWGVRMEHLLRFALLALLSKPHSTLKDIVPMFTNKTFRENVLRHVTDEEVLKFWNNEYKNMNYKNAFDGVAPIANKLGAFLANPLVRNALCTPKKPLRFRKLMDSGTPLVVNLSKGKLGADITNVLGGLVVSSLAHAAYTRVDTPEPQRRPYFLYADEFHSFTTEAFAGMLSELRKYRLGLVLAHQHTSQVSTPVLDGIFGNVGTVLVFRIGANDAPLIARQLRLENTSDLLNQANFQMNVKLVINGEVCSMFTAKTAR